MKLTLIYGSNREGRFCDTIAEWCISQIDEFGAVELNVVDPRELAPALISPESEPTRVDEAAATIAASDAILVVTPEYNHSFPAALKLVIDAFREEWQLKPVAFVSYGGVAGGTRAVQQLRQVFVELHAVCIHAYLPFASPWERFDAAGQLKDGARTRRSMVKLLEQLQWWASALKHAQACADRPYEDVR